MSPEGALGFRFSDGAEDVRSSAGALDCLFSDGADGVSLGDAATNLVSLIALAIRLKSSFGIYSRCDGRLGRRSGSSGGMLKVYMPPKVKKFLNGGGIILAFC